jgi:MoaA/NifB/PqqE/SkfB family radical SAM enzyme
MRKDLLEILDLCKSMQFEEITIQTNASNLDNFEFLNKIRALGNVKFNISFHSSDPEIFAKISQVPENYQRVLQGLEYIEQLGISAYFTIVISKLNYQRLKEHIQFIAERFPHITHFSFNFIDPVYRAYENQWTIAKFSEAERYIHEAVAFMKANKLSFRIEKLPLCYMAGFEEYSSDIRRGVLDEWRIMSFLRTRNDHEDTELLIEKSSIFHYAEQCKSCNLQILCPGINHNYVKINGDSEVFPVFEDPRQIISRVRASKSKLSGDSGPGSATKRIDSPRPFH